MISTINDNLIGSYYKAYRILIICIIFAKMNLTKKAI